MNNIFVDIYDWFAGHKGAFYAVLAVCVGVCAGMASQITLQEDITNFFNGADDNKSAIFANVKAKDKIVVMITGDDPERVAEAGTVFENGLAGAVDEGLINGVTSRVDETVVGRCVEFVYGNLPIFLKEEDYAEMERRLTREGIDSVVAGVYNRLTSPAGMVTGEMALRDPFGMGSRLLGEFGRFNPHLQYEIYDGRLFTEDLRTMLMFVEPTNGLGDTGSNDELVDRIEKAERAAETEGVKVECIGGPIVAVYNARQIKRDTTLTLGIAIVFILAVIALSFRNRWSIPLIVMPPAFGALFALAMVWMVKGEISAIAIGAGTVIVGISLSYSIHIVSHLNHTSSVRELIRELTRPLTIGCMTTIGAFAALMFTSSELLQDMGLFSVFALVGTVLFCLVFLPQFIKAAPDVPKSRLLRGIERVVGYGYDANKWVVIPVCVATVVALFYYKDVEFDDDISNINYVPEHILKAERRSAVIFGDESDEVYMVTGSGDLGALVEEYEELGKMMGAYVDSGVVEEYVAIGDFLVAPEEQDVRLRRWNDFWTRHGAETMAEMTGAARKRGFRDGAFEPFADLISREYGRCGYSHEEIRDVPVVSEWINTANGMTTVLSRITIDDDGEKERIYGNVDGLGNTAVIDRAYFSSKMVESTSEDFNYILLVSSLIVFLGLLLSYGRIELTLLTFLPMCISWVVILGMMAVFGIKFNIVNIILATFIFGIGDDFSIFIMDGLLQEFKNGKRVLAAHKTAIFFSAFTAIVGMGVLIFAEHPALKSIALISVLGLSVVVFVSYTIQPVLFRAFISSQTDKGGFPYTLLSVLNSAYCFVYFFLGCVLAQVYMLILMLLPIKRRVKKLSFHRFVYHFAKIFISTMITAKAVRRNPYNETYEKPAVVIANHQSFIDILMLLSTTPKLVMVTNSWVWRSPFFGWIVRYADFHHSSDGYEVLSERLKERIAEGYSVVIFPEGTRSADCSIQRFHKGAFYLAHLLRLDILPVLIYGAGQVSAKKQGFYIKRGIVSITTMKRVRYGDTAFGVTYQEQSKNYRRWFVEQYRAANDEFGRTSNPYFRDAIVKNYTYKGPVLEWYMRVKCRMDGYYDWWDRLLPRDAVITDVGCGYGQMSFMLGLLSSEREIVGIDYDGDKIALARKSFLYKRGNYRFECADMRSAELPESDAFLFNDSLHYVDRDTQRAVLARAVDRLNAGGVIVVRDGDASQVYAHTKIEATEVWSTRIFKFNKTSDKLAFIDAEWMRQFATQYNLHLKIKRCDNGSSESLYILRK